MEHVGLFGPRSVTWRLHGDPIYPVASLRALLLQVLFEPAMGVVMATAHRLDDPWDRLHQALQLSCTITYGNPAEAAVCGARERSIRSQVRGFDEEGLAYSGDETEVGLWLHACQVHSTLEVAARSGLQLSDQDCSTYLREQVRTAAVLGLEPQDVPTTRAALLRCLKATRPRLLAGHEARSLLAAVVAPALPAPMLATQRHRPPWAPVAAMVYPTLPPWARTLYGPPSPGSAAALSRSATTVALHALRDQLREN